MLFWMSNTLNDINVMNHSPVFDDVEQGNTPRLNFFVNQRPYNMEYYLADGIYPSYPTFIKSIRLLKVNWTSYLHKFKRLPEGHRT